jgi:hypothetical protein
MIKSAWQPGVARLGSGGLTWFSPALDRAFENKGCMEAILLEPKRIACMNHLNAKSNRVEYDGARQ